jgi:hypothetical protein
VVRSSWWVYGALDKAIMMYQGTRRDNGERACEGDTLKAMRLSRLGVQVALITFLMSHAAKKAFPRSAGASASVPAEGTPMHS